MYFTQTFLLTVLKSGRCDAPKDLWFVLCFSSIKAFWRWTPVLRMDHSARATAREAPKISPNLATFARDESHCSTGRSINTVFIIQSSTSSNDNISPENAIDASSKFNCKSTIGVWTASGMKHDTAMLAFARSFEDAELKPRTANLLAAYNVTPDTVANPPMDEKFTMCPRGDEGEAGG